MSNDKIKDSYQNSKNLPRLSTGDNIRFGTDPNDNTTTFRHDYRVNRNAKAKAFNDSRKVFDGIKSDYVNYPNKYKYNPRRPPNNLQLRSDFFKNDIYCDEDKPHSYRTSYRTDYQKVDPIRSYPFVTKEDFDTTLNEIFPKETRIHPLNKQSVTHDNFDGKPSEPIKRANKQEIEKEIVDILEHNYVGDPDNKKISIAHSSYIAPEITIVSNYN
ncbi:hypothetical protein PIROE2DRAFT_64417 [Piromyces sp. E2]|nr:hypothetical protein PIROE2DRAFT_64417 [Piromyces sp. E2]|eukprot:OUM58429.1 hypothetical protein PIROE2DRAFT_64417 [Piromyces sp. E2]